MTTYDILIGADLRCYHRTEVDAQTPEAAKDAIVAQLQSDGDLAAKWNWERESIQGDIWVQATGEDGESHGFDLPEWNGVARYSIQADKAAKFDALMTTGELTIDLTTVPAVAELIKSRKDALAMVRNLRAQMNNCAEQMEQMKGMFDDEDGQIQGALDDADQMDESVSAFLDVIATTSQAKPAPDLASHISTLLDQIKSTSAWEDAENGEDDQLKADVEAAELALEGGVV